MVMGAAAGIGIALSTAGTVAGLAQQQQQANQQKEASLQSALESAQRIELAQQRYEMVKQSAQLIKQRELEVVTAQRRAAELDVQQQILNNRLAQIQSRMGASQLRAQGQASKLGAESQATQVKMGAQTEAFQMEQAAQNNLAGRQNEQINMANAATEVGLQNANEMGQALGVQDQANQVNGQLAGKGAQNTNAGVAVAQAAQMQAGQVVGQVGVNNQERRGSAEFNQQIAAQNTNIAGRQLDLARRFGLNYQQLANQQANFLTQLGVNQDYLAQLGASSVEAQQQYSDASFAAGSSTQQKINRLQTSRNRQAVQAGYQSAVATGNTAALSQVLQEKAQISQALANANQAQAPGFLSYATAIGGGALQAYNAGVFGQGSNTNRNLINSYPPITQLPPNNNTPGVPINYYPAARYAQQSVPFGQPAPAQSSSVPFGQPLR